MREFGPTEDLENAVFIDANLRGARFVRGDLTNVVIRGANVDGLEIDDPWLPLTDKLLVNGINVPPSSKPN